MAAHRPITGTPEQRATQWVQFLAATRDNRTPKNFNICRQDLGPDHYARVLLDLHQANAILKTVLRAEANRIRPEAKPTETMPLEAWAALNNAIKPTPRHGHHHRQATP
ncbi:MULTISPECIES: hypothetical protein [Arthrobacter]|uniref:Uncharacterized protein n=1 Tax=Arthrobacter terricola TaxID=2547396 RepID=A0A4R5K6C5_9MICC|nr:MULTISPECIES: hypothetical protein [Arthrobacter]MBT8159315.1 hypothetical protein [Arthrobacter sp. GN70]TDF86873.1 hypothetical protein E1809_25465 [Arthrobacter terricola]